MKKSFFIFIIILIFSTVLNADEKIGVVSELSGKLFVIQDSKESLLSTGDIIYDMDIIYTDKNTIAEIKLNNGSILIVKEEENFPMSIFKIKQKDNFSLSLFFGSIKNLISKETDTYFTVTTPSITCGVRETISSCFKRSRRNICKRFRWKCLRR